MTQLVNMTPHQLQSKEMATLSARVRKGSVDEASLKAGALTLVDSAGFKLPQAQGFNASPQLIRRQSSQDYNGPGTTAASVVNSALANPPSSSHPPRRRNIEPATQARHGGTFNTAARPAEVTRQRSHSTSCLVPAGSATSSTAAACAELETLINVKGGVSITELQLQGFVKFLKSAAASAPRKHAAVLALTATASSSSCLKG